MNAQAIPVVGSPYPLQPASFATTTDKQSAAIGLAMFTFAKFGSTATRQSQKRVARLQPGSTGPAAEVQTFDGGKNERVAISDNML